MTRALCAATLVVCAVACTKQTPKLPTPPPAVAIELKAPEKKAESRPVYASTPVAMHASPAPNAASVAKLQALLGNAGSGNLGAKGVGSGGGGTGATVVIGGIAEVRGHGGYASGLGGLGARGIGGRFVSDTTSNSEEYGHYAANAWTDADKDHLSTFAADVDTASYTVARRKLLGGTLPSTDSVRVEEWLNYFRYHYPQPTTGTLGVSLEAAPSPFAQGKTLLRVGVQGKQLSVAERKTAHLVFLVDVSGSMQSPDKLPLAKRALRMLVDNLRDGDTVSMVTYANGVQLVLGPTPMDQKSKIHEAIEGLHAGGGTAMAGGIETAYAQAAKTLDSQSFSRVIVLSDGDANIGASSHDAISS